MSPILSDHNTNNNNTCTKKLLSVMRRFILKCPARVELSDLLLVNVSHLVWSWEVEMVLSFFNSQIIVKSRTFVINASFNFLSFLLLQRLFPSRLLVFSFLPSFTAYHFPRPLQLPNSTPWKQNCEVVANEPHEGSRSLRIYCKKITLHADCFYY